MRQTSQMKVLDLGCGAGIPADKLSLPQGQYIVGCDVRLESLRKAKERFPERRFNVACGECLPYADCTFDRVVANVSMPYMKIHCVLREIKRVLVPGGTIWISYHPLAFTMREMGKSYLAFVHHIPVLLRGVMFHFTGRSWGESFQSQQGWRLGLRDFDNVVFSRDARRCIVQANRR